MYNELKEIFTFLVSVRKLRTYLAIDIEFPDTWKIPKKYVIEDKIIENEKLKDGYRFFSFVCEFDDKLMNETINNIKNIISYNREIEMKEKLLKQKIDELKKIFEKQNFDNLQSLKFDITEEKLDDGEEIIDTRGTISKLVEK